MLRKIIVILSDPFIETDPMPMILAALSLSMIILVMFIAVKLISIARCSIR